MTDNSFPKHAAVLAIQVLALQAVIAVSPAAAAERAGGFIRVADEQPLPPDEAFRLRISLRGPNTIIAELAPAKNHYLYRNKVHFAVKNSSGVLIKEVRLPAGETKNDQFFGTMEVAPFRRKSRWIAPPRPRNSPCWRPTRAATRR